MIAYVKGELMTCRDGVAIIDNHGIGYQIRTSATTISQIQGKREVVLHTYLHVREDAMELYGFANEEELATFGLLIGVNGVGPKVALAILSSLSVQELYYAVMSDDEKTIAKSPGIGPKGAKKIILELKDKLDFEDFLQDSLQGETVVTSTTSSDTVNETVMALVSLGYSNSDAYKAISSVPDANNMDTSTLLKEALKKFMTI
ncbi:MAG: Holliday junction branch migration protein RuvA [Lachnospiraceae bacterium]